MHEGSLNFETQFVVSFEVVPVMVQPCTLGHNHVNVRCYFKDRMRHDYKEER